MRYSVLFLLIILLGFISSCKKDEIQKPDNSMIIGDTSSDIVITTLNKTVYPGNRCDPYIFTIDIDGDSIDDFSFYSYYSYGPCIWVSEMRIDCLSESSLLVEHDSIPTVRVLDTGDTLSSTLNWKSGNFVMLTTSQLGEGDCGGDGTFYVNGIGGILTKSISVARLRKKKILFTAGWKLVSKEIIKIFHWNCPELLLR